MPTKEINDAVKPIRDAWDTIKNEFFKSNPGKYLILTCVYRSPQEQMELFKKGRTMSTDGSWVVQDKSQVVTNVDGYKILGAHNYKPSRAIDVAVVDNKNGAITWKESEYSSLGPIATALGLEWGGYWKNIKDLPHIQIPNYREYRE